MLELETLTHAVHSIPLPQAQRKAICCSPGKEHGSNSGLHTGAL